MPHLRFDLIEGRSDVELRSLLDVTHAAVLEAFGVPERDRYQIVHEHKPSRMIVEDTGLGIPRSDKIVTLHITTRPRTTGEKTSFYQLLATKLQAQCGLSPTDLMVFIVENKDEDWSFGLGRAQFLTGEL